MRVSISLLTSFRRCRLTSPVLILSTILMVSGCRGDALDIQESDLVEPTVTTELGVDGESQISVVKNDPYARTERVGRKSLVLAISWQPGFCEGASQKSECQSQKAGRYDTTHFSLHGLWPQPRNKAYCNVDSDISSLSKRRQWLDLPSVQTSVATRKRLEKIMPGTRSALDRHEWIKHGTCYSKGAETYYRDSLALMDKINASQVQRLFEENIGKEIKSTEIRAAFDKAFGRGTGSKVRVACKRDGARTLITELTIGLRGVVGSNPNIGKLARWARYTKIGCPGGIVDPVGLQ